MILLLCLSRPSDEAAWSKQTVFLNILLRFIFESLSVRSLTFFHKTTCIWFQKWTFHIDYTDLNEILQRAKAASRSAVLILLDLSDAFQANDIELIQHDKTCF